MFQRKNEIATYSGWNKESSSLTDTQIGVLASSRDNPNLTKPQLAIMLHRSKTTIDNTL